MRDADGVGAGEDDQVLDGEVLGGEAVGQLGGVEEGRGQVVERVRVAGYPAVAAAGRQLVAEAAGERDAVPGREGEDVGAGDDAGALRLQGRLGAVDHVEEPEAGVVGRRVLLRRVVRIRRRVDQNRAVAALKTKEVGASLRHSQSLR